MKLKSIQAGNKPPFFFKQLRIFRYLNILLQGNGHWYYLNQNLLYFKVEFCKDGAVLHRGLGQQAAVVLYGLSSCRKHAGDYRIFSHILPTDLLQPPEGKAHPKIPFLAIPPSSDGNRDPCRQLATSLHIRYISLVKKIRRQMLIAIVHRGHTFFSISIKSKGGNMEKRRGKGRDDKNWEVLTRTAPWLQSSHPCSLCPPCALHMGCEQLHRPSLPRQIQVHQKGHTDFYKMHLPETLSSATCAKPCPATGRLGLLICQAEVPPHSS